MTSDVGLFGQFLAIFGAIWSSSEGRGVVDICNYSEISAILPNLCNFPQFSHNFSAIFSLSAILPYEPEIESK